MKKKQNDGLLQEWEFNMLAREGWGREKETAREEVMLVCLEVAESLVGRMITDRTNTRGPAQGAVPRHTACALNNSTSVWGESTHSVGRPVL